MNTTTRFGVLAGTAFTALLFLATAAASPPAQTRGADLLQPFKKELMSALQSGMREGPAAAIESCSVAAPRIVDSLSRQGVRMGRASHRLRNPANEPPAWVAPVLDGYLAESAAVQPVEIRLDAGRMGYVEPIRVQAMCLRCHGTELAPDVAERIERLYPRDRATGFEEGDLRGVFWVEYPAD